MRAERIVFGPLLRATGRATLRGYPRGFDRTTAQTLVSASTWKIYRVMGRIPWLAARVVTGDPRRRLLLATRIFRRFPFGSPSYLWKDGDGDPDVVAFDCLRCPVAEYFRSQNQAGLCVVTFCELDFRLATEWRAELARSGNIAGGSKQYDFRWRVLSPSSASS